MATFKLDKGRNDKGIIIIGRRSERPDPELVGYRASPFLTIYTNQPTKPTPVVDGGASLKDIACAADTKHVLFLAEKKNLPSSTNEASPELTGLLSSLNVPASVLSALTSDATDSLTTYAPDGTAVTIASFASERTRHHGSIRGDAIHDACGKYAGKSGDVVIALRLDDPSQALHAACAVARAFPTYSRKTGEKDKKALAKTVTAHLLFGAANEHPAPDAAVLQEVADCVRAAAHLVDSPPNELYTDSYVDHVANLHRDRLAALGVELQVIRGEELRDKGYGGIYAVGRAAEHPPALVILSYKPCAEPKKTVAFVGKGIVYDSGGLSIKPTASMCTMKTDMAGSAGVLYGFVSAVTSGRLSGSDVHLHAILCLAQNSVDSLSYRNDDVLLAHSGKTVEVNNTDAEGRLVLMDGVSHACKVLNADVIIDMATLTGAQSFATGTRHAGVLSNSEDLERKLLDAAKRSGDLAFPFIYCPEFHGVKKHFVSEVADMKNTTKDRTDASSAGAGHFIAAHLTPEAKWRENGDGHWGHVDIAFPSTVGGRATGYGVALLFEYATAAFATAKL
ncbi:putative aminopeptidase NPEPL1 [Zopfochytrium polystomum]|nr:putative aminopeptidase NPEPL1 [Zopfochytrium polystomum]